MPGIVREGDYSTSHRSGGPEGPEPGVYEPEPCLHASSIGVLVNGLKVVLEPDVWERHGSDDKHTFKLIPGSGSSQVRVFVNSKEFVRRGDPMVAVSGSGACYSFASQSSSDVFCGGA